jgi:dipeptidyl aminopeptidase/acylaminoacyl peptidase
MKRLLMFLSLLFVSGLLMSSGEAIGRYQESHLDQLPPLIDREIFFDDPEIAGAQLSPDGRFLSFRKQYNGIMNIWIKEIDEPFENARPVTADTTRPITGYFWSRDSRHILYVQDKGGDENYNIYAVDPGAQAEEATGVPPARNLTDLENVRAAIFAVPRNTPGSIVVGLNDRNPALHDVYRLDIATGELEPLFQNDHNIVQWTVDNDGSLRFAMRQKPDGGFEILEPVAEDFERIYEVSFEEEAYIIRFHKDNQRVYMMTNKGDAVDLTRLVLFDPVTGEEELIEKDPEGEVDFSGALFSDITDELLATYYNADRMRIYFRDDDFQSYYETLRNAIPEGDIYFGSRTADEKLWLITVTSDVDPGATYLFDSETGDVEFLYRPRPNLPHEHLAEMIPIRYTARDGLEIPGYLTIPKGVEPKNLPLIVNPHGGPWWRDSWGYRAEVQFLANRGYAVFQPNFRGSTGYGKEFLNAGNKEWGTGSMQHDITDGVKYLIDEGIADAERIGIYGGSYGGYATLAGLAFTPELYTAGVSFVGPSNIITLINSFPAYWAPVIKIWTLRVGDPDDPDDRQRLIEQSPLFSAHQIQTPLLVVQGANDPRVTQHESDQIVVAMRDLGRHVEYMVAPDEGHGFAGRENRIAMYVAMERFFAAHLGGRYQKDVTPDVAKRLEEITVNVDDVTLPEEPVGIEDAATAPLPEFALEYIKPVTLSYSSAISAGGQKLELASTRTIARSEFNDQPVWSVIDGASGPMGVVADTFYLDYQSLVPIHRSVIQGMTAITVDYHDTEITGKIVAGPQTIPVSAKLEAPVLGDGSALDLTLIALPLEVGYETTFRTFDLMSQKVITRHLKVVDVEIIEVPAGTFDALKLEIVPIEGDTGKRTVWVAQDETRSILKSIDSLPPMMGGGSVTVELISVQSK